MDLVYWVGELHIDLVYWYGSLSWILFIGRGASHGSCILVEEPHMDLVYW